MYILRGRITLKKKLLVKTLVVVIILLFICLSIPLSFAQHIEKSYQPSRGTTITVDDEPGDADFTSIKEALNFSSPGDTIEVYSGIYREDGIRITKENVSLLGISHELGGGNDSEKPFVKPDGTDVVIIVEASYVIVSNFRIEKLSSSTCIILGSDELSPNQNNNTISDCFILNPYGNGISVNRIGRDINIINNTITDCSYDGISADSLDFNIIGNVIIGIEFDGIDIGLCWGKNISYNYIASCRNGIHMQGSNNIIYGNDIRSCHVGILNYGGSNNTVYFNNIEDCHIGFSNEGGGGNRIIKNNFQECWNILPWFKVRFLDFLLNKDRWIGNYWEIWRGMAPEAVTSPKIIIGIEYLGIPFPGGEFKIVIPIPRFEYDWQTAKEPYDIPS